MPRFPNATLKFFEVVESAELCGVDPDYKNPLTCDVLQGECRGNFQELSASESKKEFGEVVSGSARAYLPYDFLVKNTYKVRVIRDKPAPMNGGEIWEVEGDQVRRQRLMSNKILLTKVRE